MGNTLVISVAENVEDEPLRLRTPMGSKEEARKKGTVEGGAEAVEYGRWGNASVLGAPDRLPEARRVGVAVEPLFNDGPSIEKDVSVWDREKGGPATPPPPPPPVPATAPPRAPSPAKETDLVPPTFGPADRDAVRRYFERLNRRDGR
jgi:hypothetical protein